MKILLVVLLVVLLAERITTYTLVKRSKKKSTQRQATFEFRQAQKRKNFEDYQVYIESLEVYEGYTRTGEHVIGLLDYVMNYNGIEMGTIDLYEECDIKEVDDKVTYTSPTVLKEFLNHNIRFQLQELSVIDVLNTFY